MFQNSLLRQLRCILTQSRLPEIHFAQDRVDTMNLCRTTEREFERICAPTRSAIQRGPLSRDLTRIFGEEGKENGRKSR